MRIKDLPLNFRPREKALKMGFSSLSDTELLAVILQSGTKQISVLEIAENVIEKFKGFHNLSNANISDLIAIKGINKPKGLLLLATIELTKRLIKLEYEEDNCYYDSDTIFNKYRYELGNSTQEVMLLVMLSARHRIIGEEILFRGTEQVCPISKIEILKTLLKRNASQFILIHNHPSGNPNPSQSDIESTIILKNECLEFGIKFLDHLIITKTSCFSFKKELII